MTAPHDPRANQKQRTRAAIVEAAARLLAGGVEPTVATAAEAAKVSRATAYRYFPTPEALHIEIAGVTPAYAPVEVLIQALAGDDSEARLLAFVGKFNAITFAEEARMRMALKVYLDTWFASRGDEAKAPAIREGRRMRWLDRVLEPARRDMTKARWRRLQAALALTGGTEVMVIMKDVCRLDDAEAQEVLLWAAQTLLRAGLEDAAAKNARR
ncbi:MAG: TetR family transcriptional regulator [Alphaproteobacteria bacterium]|nr:TetR family transcriptional regulator [Alphaproteobacteria bacterium]